MLPRLTARLVPCRRAGAPRRFVRMSSSVFRQLQHTVRAAHTREYLGATAAGDDDTPLLAVKQYIPVDQTGPRSGEVTIIGAHANGFPKELYEPLWDEVYAQLGRRHVPLRSVWIADIWNQGQSGVLNEKMLGNDPSWFDHARDLMNLINQKLDDIRHPIIGIGHSMGATQLLFDALVLIDPVIQMPNGGISSAILSTRRRDLWPSREMAAAKFKDNDFYKSWDPRVLDRWTEHGLRPVPTELHPAQGDGDESVTLTTTKHQELFTFMRPTYRSESADDAPVDLDPAQAAETPEFPYYRPEPAHVFKRLPELRPSTLYIFGDRSELATPELREEKMVLTGTGVGGSGGEVAGRVKQVILDCGHLVAMEKVNECASAIADFLDSELARQRREGSKFKKQWTRMSRQEQMTVDERWKREVATSPPHADGKAKL